MMKTNGFDLDIKLEEVLQGNKYKLGLNQSLNSFLKGFKSFVEKMQSVDAELSEEKNFTKDYHSRPKKILELRQRHSFENTDILFQDQHLAKSLEKIYNHIDRVRKEIPSREKIHENLINYIVQLKENFEKFKNESDYVLLTDNEKNLFYFGQGTYSHSIDVIIKNGKGIYKDENDNIYFGMFSDGYFVEGIFCKQEDDNSFSYYKGNFTGSDNRHNTKFEGKFFPSIKHGKKQKMIFFEGEIDFYSNLFKGIFIFRTDEDKIDVYQGNMINGRKDGNSTTLITYLRKSTDTTNYNYVVINQINYSNGKPFSTGIHYNSVKHLIQLNFDNTNKHKAIYLKNNNTDPYIYIGDISKNDNENKYIQTSSYGKFILSNGDFFFGEIKNGIKNGDGRLYHIGTSGKVIISEGFYENDVFKNGKIFEDYNLIYDGKFEGDLMSEGKFYYSNDERELFYEGRFKDGIRYGFGTNVYKDGSKYVGDWNNNQRHGKGKFSFLNEEITYDGDWNNNENNGKAIIKKGDVEFSTNWENNNIVSMSI